MPQRCMGGRDEEILIYSKNSLYHSSFIYKIIYYRRMVFQESKNIIHAPAFDG